MIDYLKPTCRLLYVHFIPVQEISLFVQHFVTSSTNTRSWGFPSVENNRGFQMCSPILLFFCIEKDQLLILSLSTN